MKALLATALGMFLVAGCSDDEGTGGTGWVGGAPPESAWSCTFAEVASLCDSGACPVHDEGKITCQNAPYFTADVGVAATGSPLMTLDPAASGYAVLYADVAGQAITATNLPFFGVLATDESGAPSVTYAPTEEPTPWYYEAMGSPPEVITEAEADYWVARALAIHGETVVALALRGSSAETHVLATRSASGSWSTVELPEQHPAFLGLSLATDGTPLIAYATNDGAPWIRVGDQEPEAMPVEDDAEQLAGLAIVGGASSWAAIAYVDVDRLVIRRSGEPSVIADYRSGTVEGCGSGETCSGSCTIEGGGVASKLQLFNVDGNIFAIFVEQSIDRDIHFEEDAICSDAGCECGAVVDAERSSSDLVVLKLASGSTETVEAGRFRLRDDASYLELSSAERGGTVAFAVAAIEVGEVFYASLDLAAL